METNKRSLWANRSSFIHFWRLSHSEVLHEHSRDSSSGRPLVLSLEKAVYYDRKQLEARTENVVMS